MLEKPDIAHLIRKHSLMQGEVDSRHIDLINEIYALGIQAGVAQAKAAVEWRIEGPMWVEFIEKGIVWPS